MALPELKPVQSSNIQAIGHDGKDLFVRFNGGAVWRYAGVSKANYDEMAGSGSVGKYVSQFIKPNHPGTRMDTPAKDAKP